MGSLATCVALLATQRHKLAASVDIYTDRRRRRWRRDSACFVPRFSFNRCFKGTSSTNPWGSSTQSNDCGVDGEPCGHLQSLHD